MSKQTLFQKQKQEEQAIGETYKQYIETFQNNFQILRKTFVKADTLYAKEGRKSAEYGQFYNPKPLAGKKLKVNTSHPPIIPDKRQKSKSNLRALGDELKQLQNERKAKQILPTLPVKYSDDYANSTNLFVSNLAQTVNEALLIEIFGVYGALASVKIMWPREKDPSTVKNCGFVAFMSRNDAERALEGLQLRADMKINWGRSIQIPQFPIYIPPVLQELYSPPPPSGLPFNAQLSTNVNCLNNSCIKVTIPFNRTQLLIIHRMVEFVVREGPQFELLILYRESGNVDYNFLWDFKSPEHVYYRWKLFSILYGDSKDNWPAKPFRMFRDGSVWIPPIVPDYTQGMPKQLIFRTINRKNVLTDDQFRHFVDLIKNLDHTRTSVAKAMVFCLNHSKAINDIVEVLFDSFKNAMTNPLKKIARFYLFSDILYNSRKKYILIGNLEENSRMIQDIVQELHVTYIGLKYRLDKDVFKGKVFRVLRSWSFQKIFKEITIVNLQNILLNGKHLPSN